eukprot:TRINITY_DN111324_c0_g1_i1.p1 TRINITY_DN111324_c0_g1~~TRINITY_DN111324_c0_g1_i1.p1  ORF type:complete len:332 (+),score=87.50 TRINITY_DN111324_c0_g1_i1:67-1062(+)
MASAGLEPEPGPDLPETKRPRLDAEAGEAELVAAAAKLRQTREAVEAGGNAGSSEEDVAALLALLRQLFALQVTGPMLKRTGIGREVNQRWLLAHSDSKVQAESRALLRAWMAAPGVAASGAARRRPDACTGRKGEAAEASVPKPQVATDASKSIAEHSGSGRGAAEAGLPETSKPQATTARSREVAREQKDAEASEACAIKASKPETATANSVVTTNEKKEPTAARAEKLKTESKSKATEVGPCPNEALAEAFRELAGFEFKLKANFKGAAYKKVEKALREMEEKVVDVAQVRGLPGFGKASQGKIGEFLEKGSIERLEKYRRGEFGDDS